MFTRMMFSGIWRKTLNLIVLGVSTPVLMAQTEAWVPGKFFVTRVENGQLSCGLATPAEMTRMRARMAPARPLSGRAALRPPAGDIVVRYTGFTPEAQAAFQRAVDIWAAFLLTTVPIEIEANFGSFEDPDTLAFAGPVTLFTRKSELWFPVALANQLEGRDLDPEDPDIKAAFSDSPNWYFGLDGDPPINRQDLVSVALHEIGHGLGVFDSFAVDEDGNARYGFKAEDSDETFPTVFDLSIRDSDFRRLFSAFSTPSPDQAFEAITGIKLFWSGPKTRAANGGRSHILLWAPEEYSSGSSVAHLDEDAYPPRNPQRPDDPTAESRRGLPRAGTPDAGRARGPGLDDTRSSSPDSTFWSRQRFEFGCCGHQSFFYRDGRRGD